MSTVLTRPERTQRKLAERKMAGSNLTGRHRLGRPGLIPATALVTVVRRGFFSSWLRRGRHRLTAVITNSHSSTTVPTPAPAAPAPAKPAAAKDLALRYPSAA